AVLDRFGHPREPEIGLAEREADRREHERRDVAALRERLELAQDAERELLLSGQRVGAGEGAVQPRRLRRQMDRALERGRRFVEILSLFLNQTERQVRAPEMRVELDCV